MVAGVFVLEKCLRLDGCVYARFLSTPQFRLAPPAHGSPTGSPGFLRYFVEVQGAFADPGRRSELGSFCQLTPAVQLPSLQWGLVLVTVEVRLFWDVSH